MAEPVRRGDAHGWATVLFVPADRPEMLTKAQTRGADVVLVDLEDAVASQSKAAARVALRDRLAAGGLTGPSAVCIRINAVGEGAEEDLRVLAGLSVEAVMVPKATGHAELQSARAAVDRLLADGETVGLIPQVESARAITTLSDLAAVERIAAIAFGGEDFCADLGVSRSQGSVELLVPRALLAMHAHAVGVVAIDTVYTAIGDEVGLVREAEIARQLGFSGKLLVHPAQIGPVRRVFAPSPQELAWAQRVLAAGEHGSGVTLVDGKMVDAPVLAQAARIVARSC
jgi:citrate lyase subunit beta / citryl-CoA lyase